MERQAFTALLRAHAATTRQLSSQLTADHGLTISDYEVLLRLSVAPERRLRRVDLAGRVLLSASGITRLLDGLERASWVERASCDTDRRVVYAVLTDAGVRKLDEASSSHLPQIDALFSDRFDADELERLASFLARLGDDADAAPGNPAA